VGHLAVGLAAGRRYAAGGPSRRAASAIFVALAMFPDADVAARCLGAGPGSAWLHRGALHSLAAAAAVGVAAALLTGGLGRRRWTLALAGAAVAASHGLLDTLTGGSAGVMLLWPFSSARWSSLPLLPAAPIGFRLASARGAHVVVRELLWFAPLLAYALWPARGGAAAGPPRRELVP
jgi:inner membrane protein